MKSASYYIKSTVIALLLLAESIAIAEITANLVQTQSYFSISLAFSAKIIGLMVLSLYTYALSIGAWDKWEQFILIPLPVSAGIFVSLLNINVTYAILLSMLSFLLLTYDAFRTSNIKDMLIRPDPRMILRFSRSGILFVFSVFGGVLVILHTSTGGINVGQKISEVVSGPIKSIVQNQMEKQIQEQAPFGIENLEQIDPSVKEVLEDYGLSLDQIEDKEVPDSVTPESFGINVGEIIETQVNNFLEPYKNLVNPVLAVLMFALFEFYAAIALGIYMVTVQLVFALARLLKFHHIEKYMVEKEDLKF